MHTIFCDASSFLIFSKLNNINMSNSAFVVVIIIIDDRSDLTGNRVPRRIFVYSLKDGDVSKNFGLCWWVI